MANNKTNIKDQNDERVDVLEDKLYDINNNIIETLLVDRTTNKNIIWCTDNYNKYGPDYYFNKTIEVNLITGKRGNIIKPRTRKSNIEKKIRIKEKAEVFTPSWVCNHQNNLIDEQWFGQKNTFNFEEDKSWTTNTKRIKFENKTWMDYVLDLRIEITCGEAPYVASRYDTVTGEIIEPINRIGILDRKIRVINENITNDLLWYEWTKKAYQSVYGYEWQGDSLLITRESLLYTFMEYYREKFGRTPKVYEMIEISEIISWNFWQMDGLKGVVPNSCDNNKFVQYNLFGEAVTAKCHGCESHNIHEHNGKHCKIKDWQTDETFRFVALLPQEA